MPSRCKGMLPIQVICPECIEEFEAELLALDNRRGIRRHGVEGCGMWRGNGRIHRRERQR